MPTRRPLAVAFLLSAAGCSATAAEVGGPATTTATTATIDDPAPATDPATGPATDPAIDPAIDPATDPSSGPTTGSDVTDPPVVSSGGPTTPDTVEPVRLPERDVPVVAALDPPLQPVGTGDGAATNRAEWRLVELGFWIDEADGNYDSITTQAVMAFQKYYGLEVDGHLGPITADALSKVTERPHGRSTTGTLVEVDKSKQLVFLIEEGVTRWILNTSTGTEIPYDTINKNTGLPEAGDSVTRTGLFRVNRERPEGWWAGDLGEIYRPKYFSGGIALHGSYNIPPYPASHGCVRLSIAAMDWIWESGIVPMGTTVWVHGEIPGTSA